jgi:nitroimidazol reductase NimA-like FMN-containing flavoprotein (pyridoxamine 5'-phosphate oxidase superfamily)
MKALRSYSARCCWPRWARRLEESDPHPADPESYFPEWLASAPYAPVFDVRDTENTCGCYTGGGRDAWPSRKSGSTYTRCATKEDTCVMLILELTNKECADMLTRLRFGRLGCSRDNQPYVVPFNFAYHEGHLYSVATLGQKVEWMRANPRVCVEADEIVNHYHWMSVVAQGRYVELLDIPERRPERQLAHALLQRRAMWWQPAGVRETHRAAIGQVSPIYYRIHIDQMTGRCAKPDPVEAVGLLEPARTSRGKGWLKTLLPRRWFGTRRVEREGEDPRGD